MKMFLIQRYKLLVLRNNYKKWVHIVKIMRLSYRLIYLKTVLCFSKLMLIQTIKEMCIELLLNCWAGCLK